LVEVQINLSAYLQQSSCESITFGYFLQFSTTDPG
jgi:hypothetical protein